MMAPTPRFSRQHHSPSTRSPSPLQTPPSSGNSSQRRRVGRRRGVEDIEEDELNSDGPDPLKEIERLTSLICDLQNQTSEGKKRKKVQEQKSTANLGRGFRRLVHIVDSPGTIIVNARAQMIAMQDEETVSEIDELRSVDEDLQSEQEQEKLDAWQAQVTLSNSSPEALVNFYAELKRGGGEACSDDIMTTSCRIGSLLNSAKDTPNPLLCTLGNQVRANRGLQHDTCLQLILLITLEDNEETRRKVRAFEINLGESFFLRIFYHGLQGHPEDLDRGFLKSKILILLYKLVFTSPSSSIGGIDDDNDNDNANQPAAKKARPSWATRGPVAEILNMNSQTTPRSIAYICILAHFALTNASQWTPSIYGVDYRAMYEFIVDYFEDTPTEEDKDRSRSLLRWWNREVFGSPMRVSGRDDSGASNSKKVLMAQRKARNATRAAAD